MRPMPITAVPKAEQYVASLPQLHRSGYKPTNANTTMCSFISAFVAPDFRARAVWC
jgi:hypothetical protein